MQTLNFDNQVIWFDESLISPDQAKHAFDAEYWQQQNKIIGSATGRGTTWFVELDTIQAALRHYRRGGLFGKLVEDSYLYFGDEKTRSYQEFELLKVLQTSGVNVPKPIAARVVKSGVTYKADLLSEKIPNAQDLVAILREKALPKEMYQKIGAEIRKMHEAQVNHTDLNIHNILVDDSNEVWIIDFDKCKNLNGGCWKKSNLSRLTRSFYKESEKKKLFLNHNFIELIMEGYNSD
ncbi:3-deoxy-D-manno-octulosonic acid kinase [Vibrio splendidus]|uniref:3-deoxy-D-manno-octulosonic acid kinase n=1 Tax=Vibrio splendidus TaxID=29497 RepID=UPI000D3C17A6|nr:3-deoxy-D-manno-octulosonic acid kinase [Vibrio splendidus]MDH5913334.1 3-deoxy-D-manno-octulosonic acid kinase [Vibrio splendidus]MDH5943343.1 3-deoxy-D-manno-octulosonic acid kinase [Vibrio splendidus]MDH5987007.1 3-deoxy-D-manno-octulosonic acid kinase [Vibrio splendidus]MDH5995092.1 3-deoxy-D-manno-octulosonic acid kinase [Vibrio splendidus]MDH6006199.1 3-deoxy-D-manno-octulosonic acid kinase [Vibrio splendidus]